MGQAIDQMKLLNQARKLQKELKNQVLEVESKDGAVKLEINGEMKVKKVEIDPEKVDLGNIRKLERDIQDAFNDGIEQAQKASTEKVKPLLGQMNGLGGFGL